MKNYFIYKKWTIWIHLKFFLYIKSTIISLKYQFYCFLKCVAIKNRFFLYFLVSQQKCKDENIVLFRDLRFQFSLKQTAQNGQVPVPGPFLARLLVQSSSFFPSVGAETGWQIGSHGQEQARQFYQYYHYWSDCPDREK